MLLPMEISSRIPDLSRYQVVSELGPPLGPPLVDSHGVSNHFRRTSSRAGMFTSLHIGGLESGGAIDGIEEPEEAYPGNWPTKSLPKAFTNSYILN